MWDIHSIRNILVRCLIDNARGFGLTLVDEESLFPLDVRSLEPRRDHWTSTPLAEGSVRYSTSEGESQVAEKAVHCSSAGDHESASPCFPLGRTAVLYRVVISRPAQHRIKPDNSLFALRPYILVTGRLVDIDPVQSFVVAVYPVILGTVNTLEALCPSTTRVPHHPVHPQSSPVVGDTTRLSAPLNLGPAGEGTRRLGSE